MNKISKIFILTLFSILILITTSMAADSSYQIELLPNKTEVTKGEAFYITIEIDPSTVEEDSATTAECEIDVVEDYITTFRAAVKTAEQAGGTAPVFYAGDEIDASDFVFTPTRMAVATSVPSGTAIATDDVSIDAAYAKIPVGATNTFTVHFTLAGTNNSNHEQHATVTINISTRPVSNPEEPGTGTGETEVTE